MRYSIFILCATALLLLLPTACDKMPENGDLDGQWQLTGMYSKREATDATYSIDAHKVPGDITWNVQLKLLQIVSKEPDNAFNGNAFARFTYAGDRLTIDQLYISAHGRDSLVTDPATHAFESTGIRSNTADFRIQRLTGSQLILCSALDSLVFRKLH